MRTRNAGVPKNPVSQKKTPSKKSASKTPPSATATPPPPVEVSTPEVKATPSSEVEISPASESVWEQVKASAEDDTVTPSIEGAAAPKKKVIKTRKVIRKVIPPKTPASTKAGSSVKVEETEDVKDDQEQKADDMTDAKNKESVKADLAKGKIPALAKKVVKKVAQPKTHALAKAGCAVTEGKGEAEDVMGDQDHKDDSLTNAKNEQSLKAEEEVMKTTEAEAQEELGTQKAENLGDSLGKGKTKMDVDDSLMADVGVNDKTESAFAEGPSKSCEELSELIEAKEKESHEEPIVEVDDVAETLEGAKETQDQPDNMTDDEKLENMGDAQKPEDMDADNTEKAEDEAAQETVDYDEEEGFVEPGEEDLREDDEPGSTDDMKTVDEEHKELAAAAKERKHKKEHEIYVGGLDREVNEDDVKKVFDKAGEVVEVRLLKDPATNKNRGIAFVRFATKDQAKKALSEMKNPIIRGKRCGTAANEDNDTLFIGNICNTWTKEAIKLKLKDYDVEGVENITLVQDPRNEGLSRGFCFTQFACHADAMFAYKRLQKPDAVFGHAERTAKVAFAEPLQEPDPEVMAKVKSVFVDGIPPFWDEDRLRKHFKVYGDIERVTLARNMQSAKRKDFGFVDYMTHEAAIACIEDVNKKELVDGNSKTKVRARLSNPMPKMQAVKGGMSGGFRIGRPTGRSLGRPGPPVNRATFSYGRAPRGPFNDPVVPFGRRGSHRGGHGGPGPIAPDRRNFGGPRHGLVDRGPARVVPPRREPFPLDDGGYSRSFVGRHYDEPYMYHDNPGLKRPFYMTEQDPYMEPSRVRPRVDYTGSGRGTYFRDTYGAGGSMDSSGYYGPDYGAPTRPYSSFSGRDRSYGSGPSGSGRGSGSGISSGRGSGYGGGNSYGRGASYGSGGSYGSGDSYGSGYYY